MLSGFKAVKRELTPLPEVRLPANDISRPRAKALLPVKFKCLIMDSDYMTKLGEVKLEEQETVTHCRIMLFSEENVLTVLVI